MCDYSLHAIKSRPAKVGDKLVTRQFSKSMTRGLTDVTEPRVAVCLLPGTEVAFDKDVNALGWLLNRTIKERVARFRKLNVDSPNRHHDAFEFSNGTTVLVTNLVDKQTLTVLQLPVTAPVGAANIAAQGTPLSTRSGNAQIATDA